jgi:tRNA (adenine57-N1/adenine58-N1)-methyltransferase
VLKRPLKSSSLTATQVKSLFANILVERASVTHRDVCIEGFAPEHVDCADFVFLDMPSPWKAVAHAKNAIKKISGGKVASFSPCVEQIYQTVSALV